MKYYISCNGTHRKSHFWSSANVCAFFVCHILIKTIDSLYIIDMFPFHVVYTHTIHHTYTGIRHRGCWYLNTRSGRLGTLEGRTPALSDNPFTRQNPVSKCGIATQNENFFLFGVTLGYCISGSNNLQDYQYVTSGLCMNGRGGYSRGYFIMDVYEITSQQLFRDSAVLSSAITTASPEGSGSMGAELNSGVGTICSLLVLLFALFLCHFVLLH